MDCCMRIRSTDYYDKNWIISYAFYRSYLIIYEKSDTSCINGIIKESNWYIFKDSIPGYKSYSDLEDIGESEGRNRVFRIISSDSLEIIRTTH